MISTSSTAGGSAGGAAGETAGETGSLLFVGTGEALDPALPNTSVLLRGPSTLLFDCGYAVPHAFWRHCDDVRALDGIFVSHAHADHCFGLPALLLWMRLGGRERPLTLLCGPGTADKLEAVLELGYPGSFAAHKCYPIEIQRLRTGEPTRFRELTLTLATSAHSVPNCAVRVEAPGRRAWAYSGDGVPTPATRELYRGVDIVIHECFFAAGESRRHGVFTDLVAMSEELGVRHLALLHFAAEAKIEIGARIRAYNSERAELGAETGDASILELSSPVPGDVIALRSE